MTECKSSKLGFTKLGEDMWQASDIICGQKMLDGNFWYCSEKCMYTSKEYIEQNKET